jgi:phenylacetate-CoA ligase
MLALAGRDKDILPDGSHVASYKDALYGDAEVADRISGAFRVTTAASAIVVVHVQLARGAAPDRSFDARLRAAVGNVSRRAEVVVSRYEDFPYGMGLDYERKFAYYVSSESAAAAV